MTKTNGLHGWFKQNLYAFIVLVGGALIVLGIFHQRVSALEKKIANYPSQDWFELKFQNIDDRFDSWEKSSNSSIK